MSRMSESAKEENLLSAIRASKSPGVPVDMAIEFYERGRKAGLEEAAKLCEDHGHSNGHIRGSHKHLAAAIRARVSK
jgi:hypothetical protein